MTVPQCIIQLQISKNALQMNKRGYSLDMGTAEIVKPFVLWFRKVQSRSAEVSDDMGE